jgi:hypothetical protein
MKFRFSKHATKEMERRKIPSVSVESVLESPQQIITEEGGKKAYQSQIDFGDGRMFLLRVIINDNFKSKGTQPFKGIYCAKLYAYAQGCKNRIC